MVRRTIVSVGMAVVALLLASMAALAGGWAVVTVDELPEEMRAGEVWRAGLVVRQHGTKPVHVEEVSIHARNLETGERFTAFGVADEEEGHYTMELTFPSEGSWELEIIPAPFSGMILEPITVLPAEGAAPLPQGQSTLTAAGGALPGLLRAAGVALIALGGLMFLAQRRSPALAERPVRA